MIVYRLSRGGQEENKQRVPENKQGSTVLTKLTHSGSHAVIADSECPLPVYLDCNASTPMEPAVLDAMMPWLTTEPGNAASHTHVYGQRAKQAVENARRQVAAVVDADPSEVIFTSGATESNNIAILGLEEYGRKTGQMHVVSTQIEHKAVLEPLGELERRGFSVTYVAPSVGGAVSACDVTSAVRGDTLLVSVMAANNETGVMQPIDAIADELRGTSVLLHSDAAQEVGKAHGRLSCDRVDLLSASGHKAYGPKGIGALIARRRDHGFPPVRPLCYGGGQERGLRAGTVPVALVVGLGEAASLALQQGAERERACWRFRDVLLRSLEGLDFVINGDQTLAQPHVLNLSFRGLDSDAVMLALRELVCLSNGSACTSESRSPSHVLRAMGRPKEAVRGAVRLSWCHLTDEPDWELVIEALRLLGS